MHDAPFISSWLDDASLSPTAFRVLCHLWRRRHARTGQCNPSADSIAKTCRIKRKSVWTALREAEAKGFLTRNKLGFRASNSYTLLVPPTGAQCGPVGASQPVPQTDLQPVPYGPLQGSPSEGSPIIATGSAAGEEIGELFQTTETLTPKRTERPLIPRQNRTGKRDELLEALAALDGSNLSQVTRLAWGAAARALSEIRTVCPNVTADEIRRRASCYRNLHPTWPLTPMSLAKHWGALDGQPAGVSATSAPRKISAA
jgi:hypothetical protein